MVPLPPRYRRDSGAAIAVLGYRKVIHGSDRQSLVPAISNLRGENHSNIVNFSFNYVVLCEHKHLSKCKFEIVAWLYNIQ